MEKKRIVWMDLAKGIGILLVLLNHGELSLGPVTWLGGMFYMPLFFVLAGMTFSWRPQETFSSFALRKAKRLLVPYLGYNLFLFLFFFCKDSLLPGRITGDSFFPLAGILYSRNCLFSLEAGTNVQLMTILNAPTWFLTCLFLTLLLYGGLQMLRRKTTWGFLGAGLFCVLLSVALRYGSPVLLPWSLECALYATAFLEMGHQIRKRELVERLYARKWMLAVLLAAFVILSQINGRVNMSVGDYGNSMFLYLLVGGLGSFLCLELAYGAERLLTRGRLVQAGAGIGRQSLRILCLHLFVFMFVKTGLSLLPALEAESVFVKIWMIAISFLILTPGSWREKGRGALWLFLLTWYLPVIHKGLDVQDTCFYLANYRYVFTPSVQVNELYYLFGEVLGGMVYHLFPDRELLALNLTCALVYTGVAFLVYQKLRDRMPKTLLLLCVLAGSLFAITWVHCVNWNAWSALFVTLGAWLLLHALEKGSRLLIGAAGFLLGLNAFVRMPNILFLSLVAVVFWDTWMKEHVKDTGRIREGEECSETEEKEKSGRGKGRAVWKARIFLCLRACMPMVLGGALAGIVGLGISVGLLGVDKFTEDMLVLTSLSQEGDLHSVTTGIYQFLVGIKDGLLVWLRYGVILLGAGIVLGLIKRFALSGLNQEQRDWCVSVSAVLAAGIFGWTQGWQQDILRIQVFVAVAGIVLPGIGAWYYRKRDRIFSSLCLTAMIIEGFLTIGTDTAVIYYRIYMGLPLAMTVCLLLKWAGSRQERLVVPAFALAFVLAGGLRYADTYIYHDGAKEELTATVDHPLFTGIYTTPERAQCLNRLQEQLKPYGDYELITIGNFTAAQAMTDMKPFFRSSWPDLDYLVDSLFEETLEEKLGKGIYPVVIIATEEVNGPYWMPEKVEILEELVAGEPYRKLYEDHLYALYVPDFVYE